MALPINIEDLLNKNKVESDRIEFKKGWNPVSIYRTICAFANDIENIGGGYILVGVEEENGMAKRPVTGIPIKQIDGIQKDMLQYNQLFKPSYAPRIYVEDVDGQKVLAIWATPGPNRPYAIPANVIAKEEKTPVHYIRYGTSSVEAKGERLDELRNMANRVPFDDRGNEAIKLEDISPVLLQEYLTDVDSKLAQEDLSSHLWDVLDKMDLLDGPNEKRLIKNVAAMMFCKEPERFFKTTRVEIVIFPEGRVNNPDNMIEVPAIKGPVPQMIRDTLSYLRTNVLKERIQKVADDEKSVKFYNYPYQALEEAVVNALYHRDYQEREPVEITIEPDRISILSYAGPDRSISNEAIREAKALRSRRYRNRRLGEFLKELDLTEGRATGIPTIQKTLQQNGSPKATIETDEDRSYFLIDIPCHPVFVQADVQADVQVNVQAESVDIEQIMNALDDMCQSYVQAMSKPCPSCVQVLSKSFAKNIVTCLQRCETEVSAQQMLNGLENITERQLKRKYIQPLLKWEFINMTIPNKPTSPNQKYILSEKGKRLLLINTELINQNVI